jgi:hypothetical protein
MGLRVSGVDTRHLQRRINHFQLPPEIERPLFTIAPDGHAVVPRNQITSLVQGLDKLRGVLRAYGAQPLIGVLPGRWLPGPAACELRLAVRGLTPSGANDRSGFEETTMRVSTKGFLISAFILGVSANVYAQGAGGGGAAGGQGGTGMSKPNAGGSTDTVSGASGANTMAPAGTTSH